MRTIANMHRSRMLLALPCQEPRSLVEYLLALLDAIHLLETTRDCLIVRSRLTFFKDRALSLLASDAFPKAAVRWTPRLRFDFRPLHSSRLERNHADGHCEGEQERKSLRCGQLSSCRQLPGSIHRQCWTPSVIHSRLRVTMFDDVRSFLETSSIDLSFIALKHELV